MGKSGPWLSSTWPARMGLSQFWALVLDSWIFILITISYNYMIRYLRMVKMLHTY